MKYFLIIYRRQTGKMELLQEFEDQGVALEERFRLERELRGDTGIEIVVLGAESLEALKESHGRYFKTTRELIEDLRAAAAGPVS